MTRRWERPCWRSGCDRAEPHEHAMTIEEAWRVIDRLAGLPDDGKSHCGIETAEDLRQANDDYTNLHIEPIGKKLEEMQMFAATRCFRCRRFGHSSATCVGPAPGKTT